MSEYDHSLIAALARSHTPPTKEEPKVPTTPTVIDQSNNPNSFINKYGLDLLDRLEPNWHLPHYIGTNRVGEGYKLDSDTVIDYLKGFYPKGGAPFEVEVSTEESEWFMRHFHESGEFVLQKDLHYYITTSDDEADADNFFPDGIWVSKKYDVILLSLARNHFVIKSKDRTEKVIKILDEIRKTSQKAMLEGGFITFSQSPAKNDKIKDQILKINPQDLVLDSILKDGLLNDVQNFFKNEAKYTNLKVPWRRGALLFGSPGGGKTTILRCIAKECLEKGIKVVYTVGVETNKIIPFFSFIRELAPCLVVIDDIDSAVPHKTSLFLNELDGFSKNHGIYILGATNHPEKLDPALRFRPSRFDRKYTFGLPTQDLRLKYLEHWNSTKFKSLGHELTKTQLSVLAEDTNGFTFAYLQELCVASLVGTIEKSLSDSLTELVEILKKELAMQKKKVGFNKSTEDSGYENGGYEDGE